MSLFAIPRSQLDFLLVSSCPIMRVPLCLLTIQGMEALLGGGRGDPNAFDLGGGIWGRKGWTAMDALREKLEDVKELRDLVRSLGRCARGKAGSRAEAWGCLITWRH